MAEWYKTTYCNRRDWILENLENLVLDIDEAMLCILIDYCNSNHISITYDFLIAKLKLERDQIDALMVALTSKSYLKIDFGNGNLTYDLSPLFENGLQAVEASNFDDVFTTFEKAFGRPLNNLEMEKLSDLAKQYETKTLIKALRIADAYRKLSMSYIETILTNNNG